MAKFRDVIDVIHATRDKKLLEDLMVGLTTDKERQEIAQRLEIIQRLMAGEPQRKIATDLGVGIATVTRGSKELTAGRFKILRQP